MRITAISDTHGYHEHLDLPGGDVLIHCGDMTAHGTSDEVCRFYRWLAHQPYERKIVVPGNHDFSIAIKNAVDIGIDVLVDTNFEMGGLKFHGFPWVPKFGDWARMLPDYSFQMISKTRIIPPDVDVLICHGPPKGFGDRTTRGEAAGNGCLLSEIDLKRPRLVLCGHIHEGYGQYLMPNEIPLINCSICTADYCPTNAPVTLELGRRHEVSGF